MQKYSDVVLDANGKAISGATITVLTYPAGAPATIYAADGGPAVPTVTTNSAGRFSFYAANGHYSLIVTGTGITPITYNDICLFDANDFTALAREQAVSVFRYLQPADIAAITSGTYGAIASVHGAIQSAINAVAATPSKGAIYLPAGEYRLTTALQIPYGVSLFGAGGTATQLACYGCSALNFTSYGYQIGSMFYEDFGITAASGTNQSAIVTAANASTMDGLYFNRLRFYGFNECFNLAANWNCSIERCVAQNVNCFVATSGTIVGLRIVNNRAVCAGGGAGTASKAAVDIRGGTIQETIHVLNNYFYGFDYAIKANAVSLFVNILGNDLSALVTAISYTTVNGILNIRDNYIETFGVGLIGQAQGAPTPTMQTNISGNAFVGQNGTATIGLQLNTAIGTYQFNANIEDNVFTSFLTNDIKLFTPGRTFVSRNRCMSSTPTYSMWLGQVLAGPVKVSDNWLNKAVYYDNPPDIAAGLLVLDHNTESNTYAPYSGTFTATFTPATGAFGAIAYGSNTGDFVRIGNVCQFTLAIYTTSVALGTAGGVLYISGLPFTPKAGSVAAFNVSDVRGWSTGKGPSAGGLSIVGGAAKVLVYSRAASNGDSTILNAVDLATGNPGNIVTISGSYLV